VPRPAPAAGTVIAAAPAASPPAPPARDDDLDIEPWIGVSGAADGQADGGARNPDEGEETRRPRRGRRAAVALVVLLAAAGGAFAALRHFKRHVEVPPVAGSTLGAAEHALRGAGLRVGTVAKAYSATVPSGAIVSERPTPGRQLAPGARVRLVVSAGHAPVAVPALERLARASALAKLTSVHLVAEVATAYSESVPSGEVISAAPASGSVPYGSAVHLVVSVGPAPRRIPTFAATTTWAQASAALNAERLVPVEQGDYSNTVPAGELISTTPAEGAGGVPVGSKVIVAISIGPRLVSVPVVAGDSISQAIAALRAVGLSVTEQVGPPFATKASTTDPGPNARVKPGSAITLYAS
jgi:serine/threonine-protein kinase